MRLSGEGLTALKLNSALRLDYLWQEEKYDDRFDGIGLGKQLNVYETKRYGGNWFVEWPTRYHIAAFNLTAHYEDYLPDNLLKNNENLPSSYRIFASAALQDSLLLLGGRLTITPALRYSWLQDHLKSATSSYGVPLSARERASSYVNPQIGVKYQVLPWLALKSNLAQYVREPNFYELLGDRGLMLPNEDLEAESGINYDLGFEISLRPHEKYLKRFTFRTAYFRSDVDDIITQVYDARGVGRSVNISHANIQGVEAQVNLDFLRFFRFSANATWQEAINHGEVKAFDGMELPGRFNESYFLRQEFLYNSLKLFAEFQVQEGMFYDTANLLEAANKEVFNLGISYVFQDITLDFEVRNLNDDQYEDVNGYPSPGRTYWMNVSYNF